MPNPIVIKESNITLSFPDENQVFRFENCQGYKEIEQNLAEIDVCWFDTPNNTLYLVELKCISALSKQTSNTQKSTAEALVKKLVKKSKDATAMLAAVLLNTDQGNRIAKCFNFTITTETVIKLISIIELEDKYTSYVNSVNTSYKTKFKSYKQLFGLNTSIVLTKKQAINKFDWVIS
ncbi:MAG: hypothetical protein ACRBFS_14700 [Aureispira sp.]